MGDYYVDARLHVAVRPRLGYTLPVAGRAVRACLLGDAPATEALAALDACLHDLPPPQPPAEEEEEEEEEEEDDFLVLDDLKAKRAALVEEVTEQLADLSEAWASHLRALRGEVDRLARDVARRAAEADDVRDRYRGRAPRLVDAEHARERAALRDRLEARIEALRADPPPPPPAPPPASTTRDDFRAALAAAYGRVATPRLLACKARFEADLGATQHRLADAFVRRVAPLLSRRG
jgi:hypothetical protein